MRAIVAGLGLLFVPAIAAADDAQLTVDAAVAATARAGADQPIAGHLGARFAAGDVDAARPPMLQLHADVDLGAVPALDARRIYHRDAYAGGGAGFLFVLRMTEGGRRAEALEIGMSEAVTIQGDTAHRESTMHGTFFRFCRVRDDAAPDRCLTVLGFDGLGVTGGSEAAVGTFWPVTWSGLHVGGDLYADVGAGFGGTGTMTTEQNGEVVDVIETEDLPDVGAGVAYLRLYGTLGTVSLDARAGRDFYLTVDGDLAIDDRATAELSWRRERATYRARGFVARTRWWTSKTDPGRRESTGGVELGVRRPARFVEVDAAVGAARSFYGVLDGSAAERAALGASARLTLRRQVAVVTW